MVLFDKIQYCNHVVDVTNGFVNFVYIVVLYSQINFTLVASSTKNSLLNKLNLFKFWFIVFFNKLCFIIF